MGNCERLSYSTLGKVFVVKSFINKIECEITDVITLNSKKHSLDSFINETLK